MRFLVLLYIYKGNLIEKSQAVSVGKTIYSILTFAPKNCHNVTSSLFYVLYRWMMRILVATDKQIRIINKWYTKYN